MSRTSGKFWTQRSKMARRRYRRTVKYPGAVFKTDREMHEASYEQTDPKRQRRGEMTP